MNKSIKVILICLVSFGIYFLIDELFFERLRSIIYGGIGQIGISHILTYLIVGIPIFLGTLALGKLNKFFFNLGLDKNIFKGILIALLFTLPMFIGFGLTFTFNKSLNFNYLLIGVLAAAFFEEVYFRGFLFGQIFRKTKIGFIPAVLFGAVIFAFGHLYQSQDFGTLIGIFGMTFMGAILFAWVYCEWHYNLWVSIFMHLFMNLSWMLFAVSENALGGKYANIFRFTTIAFIIAFTVIYKKRKGIPLEINKRSVWMKR